MDAIHSIEIVVNYFFQNLGSGLLPIMQFFSFCATEEFFMLVMPVLYWCVDTAIGMRVGVVIMMSSSVVDMLKMAFRLPRPYWIYPKVKAYALEGSFGLPSGHTQKAVAVWGTLAASFKKTWLWILSVFMILMIAISRLYLGVHFLSDILVGLIVTIVFLVIYWKLEGPTVRWAKRQPLWVIALFSLIVCLLPIAIDMFLASANANWKPDATWLTQAVDPFNLEGILTLNGTLFGMLIGYTWLMRSGGFQVKGTPIHLALRYLLGVAGILALRYGLKFLFEMIYPNTNDLLGLFLRFVRYSTIGLWLAALAPFLFIRLGWSKRTG